MRSEALRESIAERTRAYIDAHPSIKDGMSKRLVNYSSLARLIMSDLGITNEEAVMIACRRYAASMGRHDHEAEILKVLRNSRLELRTKMAIITAKNDRSAMRRLEAAFNRMIDEKSVVQIIQGPNALTIIADEPLRGEIASAIGQESIIRVRDDLVEITVRSPERIARTSGVLAYLASNLSDGGINVEEALSVYTDTVFIVDDADMMKAYSVLSKCIESAERAGDG